MALLRGALAAAVHDYATAGHNPDTVSEMEAYAASLVNVARCLMASGAWSVAAELLNEVVASPAPVRHHPSVRIDLLTIAQVTGSHDSLDIWQGLIRAHSQLIPRVRVAAAEMLWRMGLQEEAVSTVQVGVDTFHGPAHLFVGCLSALLLKVAPPTSPRDTEPQEEAAAASAALPDASVPSAAISCLAKLGAAGGSLLGRRYQMHRQMQLLLECVGVGTCLRLMCGMMEGMAMVGESAAISSSLVNVSLLWHTRGSFSRVRLSPDVRDSPLASSLPQSGKHPREEEEDEEEDEEDEEDEEEASLDSQSDNDDDDDSEPRQSASIAGVHATGVARGRSFHRTRMRLSMAGPEATVRDIALVSGQPAGMQVTAEQSMAAWASSYARLARSQASAASDEHGGLIAAATKSVSGALLGLRRFDSPHIAAPGAKKLDTCQGDEPFATLEWMQSILQPETWKAVSSAELPARSKRDAAAAKLHPDTATAWYRACLGLIGVATEAMMRHSGGTLALARTAHRLAMSEFGSWPMQSLAMAASQSARPVASEALPAKLRGTLVMARTRAHKPGVGASQSTRPGAHSASVLLSQASAASGDMVYVAKSAESLSKQFAAWPAAVLQQAAADADQGMSIVLDAARGPPGADGSLGKEYDTVRRLEQQAREAKAALVLHSAAAKAQQAIDLQATTLTSTAAAARIMRQRSAAASSSSSSSLSSSGVGLQLPELKGLSLDACAAFNKGRLLHGFGAMLEAEQQYRQALLLCDRADDEALDMQEPAASAGVVGPGGKRQRRERDAAWGSVRVRASAALVQLLTAQGRLGEAQVVGEALMVAPRSQRPSLQLPTTSTATRGPAHAVYRLPGWRSAATRHRGAKSEKHTPQSPI
jgi:hypothetical protein